MNSLRTLGTVLIGAAIVAAGFAGVVIFRELGSVEAVLTLVLVLAPLAVQVAFGWSLLRK